MLNLKSVASWLEQFDETERPIAQYAIRELQFITTDEIKHDLSVALRELVDEAVSRDDRHILLDSVLSQEDVDRFLKAQAEKKEVGEEGVAVDSTADLLRTDGTFVSGENATGKEPIEKPMPYMDYFPSEIRDQESGSEKFLDLTIREELRRLRRQDVQGKRRSMIVSSRNDVDKLCAGDTVELILLTDNIGSGKQVIDFITAIHRARTSGPFRDCTLRIQILAWTATAQGVSTIQSYLQQHFGEASSSADHPENLFDVIHMRETPTYKDEGDIDRRRRVLELFRKYGDPRQRKQSKGLGFGQAATRTVIIGSSCPNTVPDMFYSIQKKSSYSPLFPNKSIPNDVIQYAMSVGPKSQSVGGRDDYLTEMRKARLVQAARRPDKEGDPTWRVLIQAVLGKDKWAAFRAVQSSYHQFTQSQDILLSLGWITRNFEATERGEKVVRQYGLQKSSREYMSAHHLVMRRIDDERPPYYPQSMRGVQ